MGNITHLKLSEGVEYSQGSVVSKTLVNRKVGTITLFAFDKGESLSEHTAPFDAVIQILDGQAKVVIDSIAYEVSKGELIIMPANIPHSVEATEKFKMMLTMIRGE
ncbi:MAG: cupin domain-containing protein [Candidatus Omnitrophica bacterium]|nr:cupin domain-containing protein [Candidatus Omnitrophota bacterium]